MTLLQSKWIKLWLLWLAAIMLGSPNSSLYQNLVIRHIVDILARFGIINLPMLFYYAIFLGVPLGIIQWLIIRQHIQISGWLWVCTVILESSIIILFASVFWFNPTDVLLQRGVTGLFIGFLQWLILHKKVDHAEWWILVLIVGQMTSAAIIFIGVTALHLSSWDMNAIAVPVYGALTGAGLVVLLLRSSKEDKFVAQSSGFGKMRTKLSIYKVLREGFGILLFYMIYSIVAIVVFRMNIDFPCFVGYDVNSSCISENMMHGYQNNDQNYRIETFLDSFSAYASGRGCYNGKSETNMLDINPNVKLERAEEILKVNGAILEPGNEFQMVDFFNWNPWVISRIKFKNVGLVTNCGSTTNPRIVIIGEEGTEISLIKGGLFSLLVVGGFVFLNRKLHHIQIPKSPE
jgi:hypothetical protein